MSYNSIKSQYKTPKELLNSSLKVDKSVVVRYSELEKKLHKLGVDTKPHYTLSPPLGGAIVNLRNKVK